MKPLKFAAVILIIGAAVYGSYLITRAPVPPADAINSSDNQNGGGADALVNLPASAPGLAQTSNSNKDNSSSSLANTSIISTLDSSNLTQSLAQSLFSQMQAMDQRGNTPFQVFDSSSSSSRQFVSSMANGIANRTLPPIQLVDYKDLKISSDNSTQNKARYLETTFNIFLAGVKNLSSNPPNVIDEAILFGNVTDAQNFSNAYKNIVTGLIDTAVPSNWLDLHKRYINSLKESEMVFEATANYRSDPVKASVMLKAAPLLFKAVTEIQKEYQAKIAEVNG